MKTPCRVSFFIWKAARGKILTRDYLRRGFPIVDWCCFCQRSGENVDHLLLHCEEVSQLWSFALRSFGVARVLPKQVIDLLAGWKNWLGKYSSNIWNLVPHYVMWVIRRERNSRILKDMELTGDQTLALFVGTLFDWSHSWGFTSRESIPQLLDSLSPCT